MASSILSLTFKLTYFDHVRYFLVCYICQLNRTAVCLTGNQSASLRRDVCAGYRVSSTHAKALGVKTDAPPEVIWDVMRAWIKKQGSESKGPPADSYGAAILSKEQTIEVDFTRSASAASVSRVSKAIRFPLNPEANWGPKRRHTRQVALLWQTHICCLCFPKLPCRLPIYLSC